MRHVFIINPAAGKKGSTQALEEQIRRELAGLDYEICHTLAAGDGERLAREAAQVGDPVRIYACGGDGTLNEVVNGAAGFQNAAVTNVPKGTGNDFLKIFGKENKMRFADVKALAEGPQAAFDLIDCNGKLCIGVACAGVDARVADDVDKYKAIPLVTGMGAYVLALIENVLFKGVSRPMTIDVEGQHLDMETAIICVCNGRYYGGGFMPVGDAEPDDGVLDILIVPKIGLLTFAKLVGDYSKGLYRKHTDLISHYHCRSIRFSGREETVAVVDGEVMRDTHYTVRLSDKRVNFFYPEGLSYRSTFQKEAVSV